MVVELLHEHKFSEGGVHITEGMGTIFEKKLVEDIWV